MAGADQRRAAEGCRASWLFVIVTADQNIRYQQSLAKREIALVVLSTNAWRVLRDNLGPIVDAVSRARAGSYEDVYCRGNRVAAGRLRFGRAEPTKVPAVDVSQMLRVRRAEWTPIRNVTSCRNQPGLAPHGGDGGGNLCGAVAHRREQAGAQSGRCGASGRSQGGRKRCRGTGRRWWIRAMATSRGTGSGTIARMSTVPSAVTS